MRTGFTVVELLISILIALLGIAIILMFLLSPKEDHLIPSEHAEFDDQLHTSLLIAQKYLHNAGYGSGSRHDIALGTYQGHDAIFWRFVRQLHVSPQRYECQGLTEKISVNEEHTVHRLILLGKKNCDSQSEITQGQWQEQQGIALLKTSTQQPLFQYYMHQGPCAPYGMRPINHATPHSQQLTLIALRPHAMGIDRTIQSVICLNNIKSI